LINYGSSGSAEDVLNRLKQLKSGSNVLVDYTCLGQDTPVIANYSSQPAVALTYLKQSGDSDLTGDRNPGDDYYGLDRFGRVQDQRWRKGTSDLERVQYGYDRASNRGLAKECRREHRTGRVLHLRQGFGCCSGFGLNWNPFVLSRIGCNPSGKVFGRRGWWCSGWKASTSITR
jgi:hypothetical protein